MKPSIITKLESLKERYEELEALLGDASVISDQDKFRAYSKEYSQLEDVVKCFNRWNQLNSNLEDAMNQAFLPAIFSVCPAVMPNSNVGAWKCSVKMKANRVDLKKLLRLLAVMAYMGN